jgi:hypothetical protein
LWLAADRPRVDLSAAAEPIEEQTRIDAIQEQREITLVDVAWPAVSVVDRAVMAILVIFRMLPTLAKVKGLSVAVMGAPSAATSLVSPLWATVALLLNRSPLPAMAVSPPGATGTPMAREIVTAVRSQRRLPRSPRDLTPWL